MRFFVKCIGSSIAVPPAGDPQRSAPIQGGRMVAESGGSFELRGTGTPFDGILGYEIQF